jgi:ABC-2 type transport system permease protein
MSGSHTRRSLLLNTWVQLGLVIVIVVLANTWAADRFFRIDLTTDKRYSLDLVTRALMYKVDKPLYARVYFTSGLQPPYNNHQQVTIDKLEEMRAYSGGLMEISVKDPTGYKELEEEARRFGVQPVQYRYKSANVSELKRVYMGVALVYGDRQEVLPAITQTDSLEYDLARAIRALVSEEDRKTIGYVTGHGEPDLLTASGPVQSLRGRLVEDYDLTAVSIDGTAGVPPEVDALFVIGPQRPVSDRALYHLDQFLMRGGSLAMFLTSTRPNLRTMKPINIYHGLDALVGSYGVQVNRDSVVDRVRNGKMGFPIRQGKVIRQTEINYPLIPKATELSESSPVVKGLDNMLFPFVSSLTLAEPMPPDITADVLAASSDTSGRIKGVRTIDPNAYTRLAPGEEQGSFPLLISLTGQWASYFADKDIPPANLAPGEEPVPDNPAARLRQGADARLIVSGSADFVANNLPFMLNLTDWMLQDESLIGIRSKTVKLPSLEPLEPDESRKYKLINMLLGPVLLLVLGIGRLIARRRS